MATIRERILRNSVVTDEGCWAWTGVRHASGYAHISVPGRRRAHRTAYVEWKGEIPEGLELDHTCHTRATDCAGGITCRHRRCVNPDHLEPVTRRINLLRGNTVTAANAAKTHCKRGHEFTPANTHVARGRRVCRACHRASVNAAHKRRRAAA